MKLYWRYWINLIASFLLAIIIMVLDEIDFLHYNFTLTEIAIIWFLVFILLNQFFIMCRLGDKPKEDRE